MTGAGPFIKWAGGKTSLLPELNKHVPERFGAYFEPFLGGASLYFSLAGAGRIKRAWLSDINRRLILTYAVVRNDPTRLIRALGRHKGFYATASQVRRKAYYYKTREVFNGDQSDRVAQAAMFIFLNKTGYNGLYRENLSGEFNVPHGKYENPTICDEAGIIAASAALAHAKLDHATFEWVVETRDARAKRGDFVYFDPPYWPKNATSDFTAYSKEAFGPAEQERLRDVALILKKRGVRVLLSNADVRPIRKLYQKGFEMRRVEARRNINSKAGKRDPVGELIIW